MRIPLKSVVVGVALLCFGCKARFPSTTIIPGATTFTIDNFFTNCFKTANGSDQIDFDLVITISYYDVGAQKRLIYAERTVASVAGPNKRPVVINMNVPTNIGFDADVNVIGKDCSRCASGWGGEPGNPTGQCNEVFTGTGYTVALPRAMAGRGIQNFEPSYTIVNFQRIPNVVNSCGCNVPF